MSDDIKKCPFCGGEIKVQATKCKHCKQFIPKDEPKTEQTKDNNKIYKVITVLSLVFALSIGALYLFNNTSVLKVNGKSLIPQHELIAPESSSLSTKESLEKIIAQDEEVRKYLTDDTKDVDKEITFLTYLDNVQYYIDVFNNIVNADDDNYDNTITVFNSMLSAHKSANVKGISVVPVDFSYDSNYGESRLVKVKISSPNVPMIKMVNVGEGYFNTVINYEYMSGSYSKVVTPALREYLSMLKNEQQILGVGYYTIDGYLNMLPSDLANWINDWELFIKSYPNFAARDKVEQRLRLYTWYWLTHESLFKYNNENEQYLDKDEQKIFEDFLNRANSDSESYKVIKDNYDILKANNYKVPSSYPTLPNESNWKFEPRH